MSAPTNSPPLAGPMGDCCVKGMKHEGEPVGRIENIAGFETYISDPPVGTTGQKKIIIYFADVFGPFYINAKLLQDYFASHGICQIRGITHSHTHLQVVGYTVLGIDYFFGDNISRHLGQDGFEMMPWAMSKFEKAQKETPRWIDEIRKIYGILSDLYVKCFGNNDAFFTKAKMLFIVQQVSIWYYPRYLLCTAHSLFFRILLRWSIQH